MNNNPHFAGAGHPADFHQNVPGPANQAAHGMEGGMEQYAYHQQVIQNQPNNEDPTNQHQMNQNMRFNMQPNMYPPQHQRQFQHVEYYRQPNEFNHGIPGAPGFNRQMVGRPTENRIGQQMDNTRQNHVEEHGMARNVPPFHPDPRANNWGFDMPQPQEARMPNQMMQQDFQHRAVFQQHHPTQFQHAQEAHLNHNGPLPPVDAFRGEQLNMMDNRNHRMLNPMFPQFAPTRSHEMVRHIDQSEEEAEDNRKIEEQILAERRLQLEQQQRQQRELEAQQAAWSNRVPHPMQGTEHAPIHPPFSQMAPHRRMQPMMMPQMQHQHFMAYGRQLAAGPSHQPPNPKQPIQQQQAIANPPVLQPAAPPPALQHPVQLPEQQPIAPKPKPRGRKPKEQPVEVDANAAKAKKGRKKKVAEPDPVQQVPEVRLPPVQMQPAQMQTPQMPTPQMQTPQMQTPQMQTPQMQTPQMQTPQMQTPQMQTPQMQTPQMQTPQMQNPPMQNPPVMHHPHHPHHDPMRNPLAMNQFGGPPFGGMSMQQAQYHHRQQMMAHEMAQRRAQQQQGFPPMNHFPPYPQHYYQPMHGFPRQNAPVGHFGNPGMANYSPDSIGDDRANPTGGNLPSIHHLNNGMPNLDMTHPPMNQPSTSSPGDMLTPSTSTSESMPTSMEQIDHSQTPISSDAHSALNQSFTSTNSDRTNVVSETGIYPDCGPATFEPATSVERFDVYKPVSSAKEGPEAITLANNVNLMPSTSDPTPSTRNGNVGAIPETSFSNYKPTADGPLTFEDTFAVVEATIPIKEGQVAQLPESVHQPLPTDKETMAQACEADKLDDDLFEEYFITGGKLENRATSDTLTQKAAAQPTEATNAVAENISQQYPDPSTHAANLLENASDSNKHLCNEVNEGEQGNREKDGGSYRNSDMEFLLEGYVPGGSEVDYFSIEPEETSLSGIDPLDCFNHQRATSSAHETPKETDSPTVSKDQHESGEEVNLADSTNMSEGTANMVDETFEQPVEIAQNQSFADNWPEFLDEETACAVEPTDLVEEQTEPGQEPRSPIEEASALSEEPISSFEEPTTCFEEPTPSSEEPADLISKSRELVEDIADDQFDSFDDWFESCEQPTEFFTEPAQTIDCQSETVDQQADLVEDQCEVAREPSEVADETVKTIEVHSQGADDQYFMEDSSEVVTSPENLFDEPIKTIEDQALGIQHEFVENQSPIVEKPTEVVEEPVAISEKNSEEVAEEPVSINEENSAIVEEPVSINEEISAIVEEPVSINEENSAVVEELVSINEENSAVVEEPIPIVHSKGTDEPAVEKRSTEDQPTMVEKQITPSNMKKSEDNKVDVKPSDAKKGDANISKQIDSASATENAPKIIEQSPASKELVKQKETGPGPAQVQQKPKRKVRNIDDYLSERAAVLKKKEWKRTFTEPTAGTMMYGVVLADVEPVTEKRDSSKTRNVSELSKMSSNCKRLQDLLPSMHDDPSASIKKEAKSEEQLYLDFKDTMCHRTIGKEIYSPTRKQEVLERRRAEEKKRRAARCVKTENIEQVQQFNLIVVAKKHNHQVSRKNLPPSEIPEDPRLALSIEDIENMAKKKKEIKKEPLPFSPLSPELSAQLEQRYPIKIPVDCSRLSPDRESSVEPDLEIDEEQEPLDVDGSSVDPEPATGATEKLAVTVLSVKPEMVVADEELEPLAAEPSPVELEPVTTAVEKPLASTFPSVKPEMEFDDEEQEPLAVDPSPVEPEPVTNAVEETFTAPSVKPEMDLDQEDASFAFDAPSVKPEAMLVDEDQGPLVVDAFQEKPIVAESQIISPNSIPNIPLPPATTEQDDASSMEPHIADNEVEAEEQITSIHDEQAATGQQPISVESFTDSTGSPVTTDVVENDDLVLEDVSDDQLETDFILSDHEENDEMDSSGCTQSQEKTTACNVDNGVTDGPAVVVDDGFNAVKPSEELQDPVDMAAEEAVDNDVVNAVDAPNPPHNEEDGARVADDVDGIPLPAEPHPMENQPDVRNADRNPSADVAAQNAVALYRHLLRYYDGQHSNSNNGYNLQNAIIDVILRLNGVAEEDVAAVTAANTPESPDTDQSDPKTDDGQADQQLEAGEAEKKVETEEEAKADQDAETHQESSTLNNDEIDAMLEAYQMDSITDDEQADEVVEGGQEDTATETGQADSKLEEDQAVLMPVVDERVSSLEADQMDKLMETNEESMASEPNQLCSAVDTDSNDSIFEAAEPDATLKTDEGDSLADVDHEDNIVEADQEDAEVAADPEDTTVDADQARTMEDDEADSPLEKDQLGSILDAYQAASTTEADQDNKVVEADLEDTNADAEQVSTTVNDGEAELTTEADQAEPVADENQESSETAYDQAEPIIHVDNSSSILEADRAEPMTVDGLEDVLEAEEGAETDRAVEDSQADRTDAVVEADQTDTIAMDGQPESIIDADQLDIVLDADQGDSIFVPDQEDIMTEGDEAHSIAVEEQASLEVIDEQADSVSDVSKEDETDQASAGIENEHVDSLLDAENAGSEVHDDQLDSITADEHAESLFDAEEDDSKTVSEESLAEDDDACSEVEDEQDDWTHEADQAEPTTEAEQACAGVEDEQDDSIIEPAPMPSGVDEENEVDSELDDDNVDTVADADQIDSEACQADSIESHDDLHDDVESSEKLTADLFESAEKDIVPAQKDHEEDVECIALPPIAEAESNQGIDNESNETGALSTSQETPEDEEGHDIPLISEGEPEDEDDEQLVTNQPLVEKDATPEADDVNYSLDADDKKKAEDPNGIVEEDTADFEGDTQETANTALDQTELDECVQSTPSCVSTSVPEDVDNLETVSDEVNNLEANGEENETPDDLLSESPTSENVIEQQTSNPDDDWEVSDAVKETLDALISLVCEQCEQTAPEVSVSPVEVDHAAEAHARAESPDHDDVSDSEEFLDDELNDSVEDFDPFDPFHLAHDEEEEEHGEEEEGEEEEEHGEEEEGEEGEEGEEHGKEEEGEEHGEGTSNSRKRDTRPWVALYMQQKAADHQARARLKKLYIDKEKKLADAKPSPVEDTMEFMLRALEEDEMRAKILQDSFTTAMNRVPYKCEEDKKKTAEECDRRKALPIFSSEDEKKRLEKETKATQLEIDHREYSETCDLQITDTLGFSPVEVFSNFFSVTFFFSNFGSAMLSRIVTVSSARPKLSVQETGREYPSRKERNGDASGGLEFIKNLKHFMSYCRKQKKSGQIAERVPDPLFAEDFSRASLQGIKKSIANHELGMLVFNMDMGEDGKPWYFRGCIKAENMTKEHYLYWYAAILGCSQVDKGFTHKDISALLLECAYHLARLEAFGNVPEMGIRLLLAQNAIQRVAGMPSSFSVVTKSLHATRQFRKGLKILGRGVSIATLKWLFITATNAEKKNFETLKRKMNVESFGEPEAFSESSDKEKQDDAKKNKFFSDKVRESARPGRTKSEYKYNDEYEDCRMTTAIPLRYKYFFTEDRTEPDTKPYLMMNTRDRDWIVTFDLRVLREKSLRELTEEAERLNLTIAEVGETTTDPRLSLIYEDYLRLMRAARQSASRQRTRNEVARAARAEQEESGEGPAPPPRRGRKRANPDGETSGPPAKQRKPRQPRQPRQPAVRKRKLVEEPETEITQEVTSRSGRKRVVMQTWVIERFSRGKKDQPEMNATGDGCQPPPAKRGRRKGGRKRKVVQLPEDSSLPSTSGDSSTSESAVTSEASTSSSEASTSDKLSAPIVPLPVRPKIPEIKKFHVFSPAGVRAEKANQSYKNIKGKAFYALEYAPECFYFFTVGIASKVARMSQYASYLDYDFNKPTDEEEDKVSYISLSELDDVIACSAHPYKRRMMDFLEAVKEKIALENGGTVEPQPDPPVVKRGRKRGSTMHFANNSGSCTIKPPKN